MSFLVITLERLIVNLASDVSYLNFARAVVRSLLVAFIGLFLLHTKCPQCFTRLSAFRKRPRRSNDPPASPVESSAPLPEAAPASVAAEAESQDTEECSCVASVSFPCTLLVEPKQVADCESSKLVEASSLWEEDEKRSESQEVLDGTSVLDEMWSASDLSCGPEAAVTADANNVLETALASGDERAADAALAAGVRLCNSSWLTKASSQLRAAGIPLMPDRAFDLVRVYGQERRADLAVDLWELHCDDLGMDPSDGLESEPPPAAELYGAALEACARAGDFETAARAAEMAGWRVPPCRHGQAAFLALARWYARRQDVSQALACYQSVRDATGSADLATHRAVLIASVRSADMAKADALFRDLLSSGIDPDGASFSALICGHCSAGNVEKAMDYFRFLREKGIVPTAPLFDAILDGCAWVNMPALMEQVLAEMEAAGVRPSTKTLSILMRLHGLNRDTEQALAVFNELPKKHGLTLDGRAYGTLISVCLKSDTYDLAWSTFERMSRAACMAHSRTYEALISECLRRGCLENAARVVTETLGLSEKSEEETTVSAPVRPRVRLQAKIFEDALRLIGRRRQAALLGLPLLEKLEGAEIEISQPLADAIRRSASAETRLPCSELQRRQEQLQQWRSFPKGRLQPLNEEAD